MTLLEKAENYQKKMHKIVRHSPEELELALAFIQGKIGRRQVEVGLACSKGSADCFLASCARELFLNGKIILPR